MERECKEVQDRHRPPSPPLHRGIERLLGSKTTEARERLNRHDPRLRIRRAP